MRADEALLRVAMNVECQTIRVPTGVQDYRPALYGGIAAVELGVDGVTRVGLDVDPAELERRIVARLHRRASQLRHQQLGDHQAAPRRRPQVFDCFERIRDTAVGHAATRSSAGDWDEVGRQIAAGMGEPEAARARRDDAGHRRPDRARRRQRAPRPPRCAAPAAAAACSATVRPTRRSAIAEALAAGGARVLDYRIEIEGLRCG